MQPLKSLHELSKHANIEVYSFTDKDIFIYDDHRTLLNVIFEAHKLGLFHTIPNLIYFDLHDDACLPNVHLSKLLKKWKVQKITDVDSRDFWSFVEFDLGELDDDWLLAGMELGLINHSVVIGQEENSNIFHMKNNFTTSNKVKHELYSIKHLNYELGCRGCLGDNVIKEQYYENVRNIFEYNQPGQLDKYSKFSKQISTPFILDFDLDCFTMYFEGTTFAWPEKIFADKFYNNQNVYYFMQNLIQRSTFITICREPSCCGGLGESNKILGYLDKYLFDGKLGTQSIV